jgi:hypothetical protein
MDKLAETSCAAYRKVTNTTALTPVPPSGLPVSASPFPMRRRDERTLSRRLKGRADSKYPTSWYVWAPLPALQPLRGKPLGYMSCAIDLYRADVRRWCSIRRTF